MRDNQRKAMFARINRTYQIRGSFPPGDMTFDNREDAEHWKDRLQKEGCDVP